MELEKLNKFFRLFGVVLVIEVDTKNYEKPSLIYFMRWSKFLKRTTKIKSDYYYKNEP